jgi:DeoR/GlpR family transcriptional regulator of sugar metabolism
MRKAECLFQLIQILRRTSRPITAAAIALEFEVSKRTVYRDVADRVLATRYRLYIWMPSPNKEHMRWQELRTRRHS